MADLLFILYFEVIATLGLDLVGKKLNSKGSYCRDQLLIRSLLRRMDLDWTPLRELRIWQESVLGTGNV